MTSYDPSTANWNSSAPVRPSAPTAREKYGFSTGAVDGDHSNAAPAKGLRDAAARARQLHRFEVRPGACLPVADGRVLHGGDAVVLEDLAGDRDWLQAAIAHGVVSELSAVELAARTPTPGRDRYRVAPGKSILVKVSDDPHVPHRVIDEHSWISATDFAEAAKPAEPEVAPRLAMNGKPEAGKEAVAARPGNDGTERLQRLLSKGLVIDTLAEKEPTNGHVSHSENPV